MITTPPHRLSLDENGEYPVPAPECIVRLPKLYYLNLKASRLYAGGFFICRSPTEKRKLILRLIHPHLL